MLKLITKNKKGFTLLESLISIFILTLAITGPIYISSFSLRNTISSRDNIAAQYLAEEVIEVIKNKRDQNLLNNQPWLSSITGDASCIDDANNPTGVRCVMNRTVDEYDFASCNGNCDAMNFSSSSDVIYGFEDPSVTDKSKFVREFYLEKGELDPSAQSTAPSKEIKLIVNIKWLERGQIRTYSLTERLYNINYVDYFLN